MPLDINYRINFWNNQGNRSENGREKMNFVILFDFGGQKIIKFIKNQIKYKLAKWRFGKYQEAPESLY